MAEMSDASLVFLDDEEVEGGIAEETKSVKISILDELLAAGVLFYKL